MSELSEKELLLLSNYEYFYCSTYDGTIRENINSLKQEDGSFDMDKVRAQGATGDIISEEDAVDILNRLESNDKLANLHKARGLNNNSIRASLFTNEDESEATLVFRGTGGTYRAWKDNVMGEYQTDTKLQTIASDFIKYECADFKNITVTGHSKGGNLAQYVTVVSASQIDRCVSFDGQGFGDNFIEEHSAEIEVAKPKITSICAFNDFVNILLTPIAGTILYVKNQEDLSVDMHSCYTMLSNGSFDDEGNFKRDFGVVPQLPAMTLAKWATDGVVNLVELLPNEGNEKASNLLAAWVASIFSYDKTEEYMQGEIDIALGDFKKYTGELLGISSIMQDEIRCRNNYLFIQIDKVKRAAVLFEEICDELRIYPEYVEDILSRLDYSILGRSLTEKALEKVITRLNRNLANAERLKNAMVYIIGKYEEADAIV